MFDLLSIDEHLLDGHNNFVFYICFLIYKEEKVLIFDCIKLNILQILSSLLIFTYHTENTILSFNDAYEG